MSVSEIFVIGVKKILCMLSLKKKSIHKNAPFGTNFGQFKKNEAGNAVMINGECSVELSFKQVDDLTLDNI